jgi:hypothetical protein
MAIEETKRTQLLRQVLDAARAVVEEPGADIVRAPLGPLKAAIDTYDRLTESERV